MSRKHMEVWVSKLPLLVWTHRPKMQTCEHDLIFTPRCPGNKYMEVWVSNLPLLVCTHRPKLQTCEHDLTITLGCPEIKLMEVWVSFLPLRCLEIKQMEVQLPSCVCLHPVWKSCLQSRHPTDFLWQVPPLLQPHLHKPGEHMMLNGDCLNSTPLCPAITSFLDWTQTMAFQLTFRLKFLNFKNWLNR